MAELNPYKKFRGCEELPDILLLCTDASTESNSRFKLHLPWIVEGIVYATDGRIITRMPSTGLSEDLVETLSKFTTDSCILPAATRRVPKIDGLFDGEFETEGLTLPETYDPIVLCDKCDGKGYLIRDCSMCQSDNYERIWEDKCPGCVGKGEVVRPCRKCDCMGYIELEANKSIEVAGVVKLARKYVYMIRSHGVDRVFQRTTNPTGQGVAFRLNDVEGRLMPMTA